MTRVTIACPQAHISDANQLAMVLGYGPADGETYGSSAWQDAQGNLYACASLPIGPNFVTNATSPLVRPEWDVDGIVDMIKAAQAQALVAMWQPSEGNTTPPIATHDVILAVVGDDGAAIAAAMGLHLIDDPSV